MTVSPDQYAWRGILAALLIVAAMSAGVAATARFADSDTASTHAAAEPVAPAISPVASGHSEDRVGPSVYCTTVVPTAIGRPDVGGAPVFENYWNARRQYEYRAALVAPGPIVDAWHTVALFTRDVATPVVIAARFDPSSEPTPPADVQAALAAIAGYDRDHC